MESSGAQAVQAFVSASGHDGAGMAGFPAGCESDRAVVFPLRLFPGAENSLPSSWSPNPKDRSRDKERTVKPSNEPCKTQRSSLATAVLMALFGMTTGMVQANFDIPTGSSPSPLFGAQPFTQQMLMFEEFGPQALPTSSAPKTLPAVGGCLGPTQVETTDPNSSWNTSMDAFLTAPLWPAPTEQANTSLPNAWASAISTCLGRQITGPLEGRPPGPNFA
ncbi:MAG TPA: hypothetical protein VFV55_00215, partial [Usitatibacteraceae bacterium]|nr:hypothetical protein [Usitatibacteraceae bacterium]